MESSTWADSDLSLIFDGSGVVLLKLVRQVDAAQPFGATVGAVQDQILNPPLR